MKALLSAPELLPPADEAPARGRPAPAWLNLIREAVESADYGTVQIKVHGGEVVQIETSRKIRVPSSSKPTAHAEAQQPR
ncbi:MAG: YezD family protein [Verrucomicrobiota bacterium]